MKYNVLLKIYDSPKYNEASEKVAEIEYTDVKNFAVIEKTDEEIYNMGFNDFDPCQEYLFLKFADDSESTFRNSYVDMFLI